MFSAPFLASLLNRVKAVVRRVVRPGVARARPVTADVSAHMAPGRAISPMVRGLARRWLSARLRALSALMRRIEAGAVLERPGPASRGAARGADASAARGPVPPEQRLPRGFGWMCAFGPDVRRDGAAFAAWLNEPAMRAIVMAAPEEMARVISPILNATGEGRPAWLPELPERAGKNSFPPCGERLAWGVDESARAGVGGAETQSRECRTVDPGSCRMTPPLAPFTRGRRCRSMPPARRAEFDSNLLFTSMSSPPDRFVPVRLTEWAFAKMRCWPSALWHDHIITISKQIS
jgi:hypothetical protein